MKRTALRRKTGLKPITEKTAERNRRWAQIVRTRIAMLRYWYGGYPFCEYCGKMGMVGGDSILSLWGHHIDRNRNNCIGSNCMIIHNACSTIIHDNNLKVGQLWFLRNDKERVSDTSKE